MAQSKWRYLRPARWMLLAGLFLPPALGAQTGRITGTVTGPGATPLFGAVVTVTEANREATTGADGRYIVDGIRPGTYSILVRRIGNRPQSVADVVVRAGESTAVDVTLEDIPQQLSGIVVSASRRVEKITDAPATITRLDGEQITSTAGYGITNALKEVKGVDFVQVGMTTAGLNARGFNSSFNNRMLQMEDGRIAVLAESGLPIGNFTPTPKIDIAAVEVLVGPGAALYGPDASNGVVTTETRDPVQYPGSTVDLTVGNRNFFDLQGRYAARRGNWAYKVAAEYLTADEFSNRLNYGAVVGTAPNRTPEQGINWTAQAWRTSAAVGYYRGANRLQFSGGYSNNDGVGITNVGRNQLENYHYSFLQAKYTTPRLYFNAYRTASGTGETYAINAFSQNRVTSPPSVSDDSVKHLSDFPGSGTTYAGEAQHNFYVPALLNTRIVWGGQLREDLISSERQWLDDRVTGEDIAVTQYGLYGQTETNLGRMFRVVLAARFDKHEDYESQFSPKGAVLFTPVADNTFRLSYGKAYKSPSTLQNHFSAADFTVLAPTLGLGVFGNRQGFTIKNAAGTTLTSYDPLVPETNTTWELGYKGIIADRLYIDVTGYKGTYENFLTPLITIANPLSNQFAYVNDEKVVGPTGREQIVLTYLNVPETADLTGFDVGLRYFFSDHVGLGGTYSSVSFEGPDTTGATNALKEATSLNTSPEKWTLGVDFTNLPTNLAFGVGMRKVVGYFFRSGINVGEIPGFTSFDAHASYHIPSARVTVSVTVNNFYGCSKGRYNLPADPTTTPPPGVFDGENRCGFGEKHMEMINAPELGTMAFFGVRYHH